MVKVWEKHQFGQIKMLRTYSLLLFGRKHKIVDTLEPYFEIVAVASVELYSVKMKIDYRGHLSLSQKETKS